MDDKTGNESNRVQQPYGADCVQFSHSVLTRYLPDGSVGRWLSSVESVCWNVEILQGQEAMADVDQENFQGNWNTSWNGRGTLWNSTAAPGTIGWKQMNCCLNFLDAI